jgi:hypothetical protein
MPGLPLLLLSASSLLLSAAIGGQAPQLLFEIRPERGSVRAGDEISVSFVVSNAGTTTYKYVDRSYDRSGRMGEYRLHAFDESGAPVPDPRATSLNLRGYIGGGLGAFAELRPGERLTKTIALNLWALVTTPGVYTVRGTYTLDGGATLESAPVTIRVLPRTDDEMGEHIDALVAQLARAGEGDLRTSLIRRLMYTGDRRAVQPLLEIAHQDNNASFWIGEAFSYYLPQDGIVLNDVVATVRRNGLSPPSVGILEQLQATPETIKELIGLSLVQVKDDVRAEAALAAQRHPDDRFMSALIQLASSGRVETRIRAIHALAHNRTDAGVAALRSLRQDLDARIRSATERAIEIAYEMSSATAGRPLRRDDFPDIAKR